MSKFNETVEKETVTNYMGAKAYKQTPKEELAAAVLTSFVEDSYYEKKSDLLTRIQKLVKEISKKDPEFVAKLAIYARTKANMRSVFAVLVGELAKNTSGNGLVRKTIAKGTARVDDLTEIAAYIGAKKMTSSVKRGIADALNKFDEYSMAKYRGEDKEVSLVDLVNLVHPKANNEKTASALSKLMKGELKNTDTWEAQMSAGKSARETFSSLLDENKLGYMALLRNLRNIVKTGDGTLIQKAAGVIADPEKVKKSKQLPFRFISAASALDGEEGRGAGGDIAFEKDIDGAGVLKKAINTALEVSVQNIPLLEGRTLILSDNSGSMTGDGGGASLVSAMSKRDTADIANLFATLYWSRANNTMVGLFGDKLINPKLDRTQNILENFKTVQKASDKCGRSTEEGAFKAFEELVAKKIMVDRIVVFSDCQLGRGCNFYDTGRRQADTFNKIFNEYRKINPTVKVYTVNLKGYGNDLTPQNDEGMVKLAGWSEKIFDIMQQSEMGPGALTSEIEKIEI